MLNTLEDEYIDRLAAGDPEAREIARDWSDNDGAPWRLEVWAAAGFVALFVSVAALVALFSLIKSWSGG